MTQLIQGIQVVEFYRGDRLCQCAVEVKINLCAKSRCYASIRADSVIDDTGARVYGLTQGERTDIHAVAIMQAIDAAREAQVVREESWWQGAFDR